MKKMIRNLMTAILVMFGVLGTLLPTVPVYAATTGAGYSVSAAAPGRTYYIVSKGNANLALDAVGGSSANGTRIWLYSYNSSTAQQYRLRKNSDGTYTLANAKSGKVFDIKGGSKANGAPLQLYQSNGTNAQKWQLKWHSDGTVTFINKGSGKAIDVPGASFKAKKYLQQYTSNGTNAQRFYLIDAAYANGYVDASQVYTLLNQFRRTNGRSALQHVAALENTARVRAKECVQICDHIRPNGTLPDTAFPQGYYCIGENLTEGPTNAAEAIAAWKDSPDHRENMLDTRYRYVGIAAYRSNGVIYWVQAFAG